MPEKESNNKIPHQAKHFCVFRSEENDCPAFRDLIKALPGIVYWKDTEGNYLACNNGLLDILGKHSILGQTDFDIPWTQSIQSIRTNDLSVIVLNSTLEFEETITLANGQQGVLLTRKSPLRNQQGQIIGVLGISIDITQRKKIEEAHHRATEKTAILAKTEFLEQMRHDIRTPLTGIVGFSELIRSQAENPRMKEYADNLVASSHALLSLMEEVLESIHVSSGEIPRVKKKFILYNTTQQVIDLNKATASAKKLDLSLDFDSAIPQYLIGDQVRIHRIMLELLANALNFTDSGFVKLAVKLAKQTPHEAIIKFIVTDSGIGIPEDKQQEIFLQFKRLIPSYKGIYQGMGLGLSVIKQFIEELDGEIYVDSILNKGTKFICMLPLKIPLLKEDIGVQDHFAEQSLLAVKPKAIINSPALTPKTNKSLKHRILVVDDHKIAQAAAAAILTECDCEVDLASDGQSAIEFWQHKDYDLIFMDIGLPDLDGYEVSQYIRLHEIPKQQRTPIIALSAHIAEENKQHCMDSGINAIISKPLTQKNCNDILNAFIPALQKEPTKNAALSCATMAKKNLLELSAFPIFDPKEGVKMTGTEDILYDILNFMLKQSFPEDMSMLRKAHEQEDWSKIKQIIHKIRGSLVYLGAVRMKMACQYFEEYQKDEDHELREKLYQQILVISDESITEMAEWLKNRSPR